MSVSIAVARGSFSALVFTLAALIAAVVPSPPAWAEDAASSESFDWDAAWEEAEERSREEQRLIEKARQVNEGELELLSTPPEPNAARMQKRIRLDRNSLKTGWAAMRQCHENLDPAPAVQIVYNPERTRDIRITDRAGVGVATVDGASVQMREIERGARLCVRAEVLAIEPHPTADGYRVENGPFMRRFLDGYYPMQVHLAIDWPSGLLRLVDSDPEPQPGLAIETRPDGLVLDAHFEGRLVSRLHLMRGSAP